MRRGLLSGSVGLAATLLALGLVVAPETVRAIAPLDRALETIESQDPRTLLLGVGLLAGAVATAVARSRRRDQTGPSRPTALVDRPPEAVTSGRQNRPGGALDGAVERAVDGDQIAAGDVREVLEACAVRTLCRQPGLDPATARASVTSGQWTADELAAAFVGSARPPLSARLREWLDPAAEQRRRIDRTISAIEALGADER